MYWIYEDILCFVRNQQHDNCIPLYRFFDGINFRYTIDSSVMDPQNPTNKILCYISVNTGRNLEPLYYLNEIDYGNSILCVGEEGKNSLLEINYENPILFGYVQKDESEEKVPLFIAKNHEINDYFYTTSGFELDYHGPLIKRIVTQNIPISLNYVPILDNKGNEIDLIDLLDRSLIGMLPRNLTPIILDNYYYCPSEEVAERIIRECKISKRTYLEEVFDCDDFTHMLKTAFIEDAYEFGKRTVPYCIGMATGTKPDGEGHAVNIIVIHDGTNFKVKIVDPQNGILLDPSPDIIKDIELVFF